MTTTFGHVGLVASDVDVLAAFYERVFGCEQVGPRRDLSGDALARGMGLRGARVRGVHLKLPDLHDEVPSTLEILDLDHVSGDVPSVDRRGLMHICFRVDDVRTAVDDVLAAGGSLQGEPARVDVPGVGGAWFVYARDPEGNLVELQQWE